MNAKHWFFPQWQPHPSIRTCITTRLGDLSPPPWQGFNLGLNTQDDEQRVLHAREIVWHELGTEHPPHWLEQVHGKDIVIAGEKQTVADGVLTAENSRPCVVLTADCLPVLLARCDGSRVAAVHGGWRGVKQGILLAAVEKLAPNGEALAAYVGPAISQAAYQVGEEVYDAFAENAEMRAFFRQDDAPQRWRFDLPGLAKWQLENVGVETTLSHLCTVTDEQQRFYSYRKEGQTGRFASLIWLAKN